MLRQALAMYDDIARHLGECDAKLQGLLNQLGSAKVDMGKVPGVGSKTRAEFGTRQILANWAGVDRTRINGPAPPSSTPSRVFGPFQLRDPIQINDLRSRSEFCVVAIFGVLCAGIKKEFC